MWKQYQQDSGMLITQRQIYNEACELAKIAPPKRDWLKWVRNEGIVYPWRTTARKRLVQDERRAKGILV